MHDCAAFDLVASRVDLNFIYMWLLKGVEMPAQRLAIRDFYDDQSRVRSSFSHVFSYSFDNARSGWLAGAMKAVK